MSKSIASQLKDYLDINAKISFKKAKEKIPKLSRSNYDKIKHEWRKDNKKILTKKSKKNPQVPGSDPGTPDPDQFDFTELTAENLETLIVKALKRDPHDTPMLRSAIDFYCKVKLSEGEPIDELDMNKFLKIGEKLKNEQQ